MPEVFGWDIGGAHVKACRTRDGVVLDAMQWACPLWQGLDHLDAALQAAQTRWQQWPDALHAVTMTGEMVDLFEHREAGVQAIAAHLADRLSPAPLCFFAGDAGWCTAAQAAARWPAIASANWLATARHAALVLGRGAGVLVDIGSTTTDLITFRDGRVLTRARSDVDRLASGELLYQGVVRTPLCALAQRVNWRGRPHNVMNEFFATAADVHRSTGELDPAHDLHLTADQASKDARDTRRRVARMIGLDERDATPSEWLDFAREWRTCQVETLGAALRRVMALHGLGADTQVVSAGCGDFLVPDVAARAALERVVRYGEGVARIGAAVDRPALTAWAQVCAPGIAVAALREREPDRCGS